MLKINKMYSADVQGGGLSFDYASYDAVLEDIKKKRNELLELCDKTLVSRDVESAVFLESLNQKLNEIPRLGKSMVEMLNQMITSMENVSANYKAAEARAASNIMNN